ALERVSLAERQHRALRGLMEEDANEEHLVPEPPRDPHHPDGGADLVCGERFQRMDDRHGRSFPGAPVLYGWIARQTRSGVTGMSRCSIPNSASASTTALTTAPSAGVVPPSPPPRNPSGFDVEGTSLSSVTNDGSASARGNA